MLVCGDWFKSDQDEDMRILVLWEMWGFDPMAALFSYNHRGGNS